MLGTQNLLGFLLAAALVVLVPGPTSLYVAGSAVAAPKQAWAAVLGIAVGDVILMTLAGLGFASLVAQWPGLLAGMRGAGAVYLVFLAWGTLRQEPQVVSETNDLPVLQQRGSRARRLREGLVLTLTNPKPILFFTTFFPMFMGEGEGLWSFYVLGGLFEAISVAYLLGLIVVVGLLRGFAIRHRVQRRFRLLLAAGLLICAASVVGCLRC